MRPNTFLNVRSYPEGIAGTAMNTREKALNVSRDFPSAKKKKKKKNFAIHKHLSVQSKGPRCSPKFPHVKK